MSDQTQQSGGQQQHHQQLRQHGVNDQRHLAACDAALRAGFSITDVIGWVTKYGPGVLELVEEIVNKVHPPQPAGAQQHQQQQGGQTKV